MGPWQVLPLQVRLGQKVMEIIYSYMISDTGTSGGVVVSKLD